MFGNPLLNFLDRHLAVVCPQDVVQHVLRILQRDRPSDQLGIGADPVQGAFQLAHV